MRYFPTHTMRHLLAVAVILFTSCAAWGQSAFNPPFWEVRNGQNTVYLFGTIHVGRADFYPLPTTVRSAFDQSDLLALEVDPGNEQEALAAMMSAMYVPPDGIENHVSASLLSAALDVSAAYGLRFEQIRPMKPYLLMFTLTTLEYSRLGYEGTQGLEDHLSRRAKTQGKQVVALESMIQQMNMLENLSPQLQSAMLGVTVDEIANNEVAGLVEELVAAWRSGDVDHLATVLSIEERRLPDALAEEFHQRFLTQRNVNMVRQIERMLQSGQRGFVAVGALHMVGDDGIPAMLRDNGYDVRLR